MRWTTVIIALMIALNFTPKLAAAQADGVPNPETQNTLAFTDLPVDVRNALQQILPSVDGLRIKAAPMDGYYELGLGSDLFYLSANGELLIQGRLVNLKTRTDLGEASLAEYRQQLLGVQNKERMINFAPDSPQYAVYVFTDIDCTYCRKLHSEIAAYNDLGIAVHYLMFPRGGLNSDSFTKAESVWCAKDREDALTRALGGESTPPAQCDNPLRQQFELGKLAGVAKMGTPTIVLENGQVIRGYVPPAELYAQLQRNRAVPAPASAH